MSEKDGSLVKRIIDGDYDAFLNIIEKYMDFVYYTCGRRVKDYSYMNLVVFNVFKKLLYKLPNFSENVNLTKCIYNLTINETKRYYLEDLSKSSDYKTMLLKFRINEILENKSNESGITIFGIVKSGFIDVLSKEECDLLMYRYAFRFRINTIKVIVRGFTLEQVFEDLMTARRKLLSLIPKYVEKESTNTESIQSYLADHLKTIRNERLRLTPKQIFHALPIGDPPNSPCVILGKECLITKTITNINKCA